MSAQNPLPPSAPRLNAKDIQLLASAFAKADAEAPVATPKCNKRVWVGLFFDGTNNNMKRDEPLSGHSNIVRLYHAFPDKRNDGYFKTYLPGVGTPFPEIGETAETAEGKAYAKGGAARIQWALIQVLNSLALAANIGLLIDDARAAAAIKDVSSLKDAWSLFNGKRRVWFQQKAAELRSKTEGRQPRITNVDISVFGFSRGAAEARAFANWLIECCEKKGGKLTLAGMPLNISFMGLFDTVASVGLAASFPVPVTGHFDWADGTMRVPEEVGRCVHLVAAHEIRASFPLNSGRDGKTYPPNVSEIVYPGAHSNLGGGYAPGEQGRSRNGVPSLLSQIPLMNMYTEAIKAGVPLDRIEKMPETLRKDFEISPTLRADFAAYLKHAGVGAAKVETMLEAHMRYYRRYKAVTANWETSATKAASAQDKQDLKEAAGDFEREARMLRAKEEVAKLKFSDPRVVRVGLSNRDKQLLEDLQSPVHTDVLRFLDNYVHDSHAGFYLAGPVTAYDKQQEIKRVEDKVRAGDELNDWEEKVWRSKQQRKPFPVMTDSDQWDMLHGSGVVVVANTNTRREGTGYFRQRTVFDES